MFYSFCWYTGKRLIFLILLLLFSNWKFSIQPIKWIFQSISIVFNIMNILRTHCDLLAYLDNPWSTQKVVWFCNAPRKLFLERIYEWTSWASWALLRTIWQVFLFVSMSLYLSVSPLFLSLWYLYSTLYLSISVKPNLT